MFARPIDMPTGYEVMAINAEIGEIRATQGLLLLAKSRTFWSFRLLINKIEKRDLSQRSKDKSFRLRDVSH